MNAWCSYLSLIATSSFALFLMVSQPHRVHHFFEEHAAADRSKSHSHDHTEPSDHHDHDGKTQPQAPDCVLHTAAQHAHATLFELAAIQSVGQTHLDWYAPVTLCVSTLQRSTARPRAPPTFV